MHLLQSLKSIATMLMVLGAALVFAACGGGASGGNPDQGAEFLELASEPSYGVMGTTNTVSSFNIMMPSPVSLVGPNDFASATGGDANFLVFDFSLPLQASSVTNNLANGTSGIVVRNSAGSLVPFFLDSAGAIDPTNTFPSAGVAPALLRIYFEDPANPGVPIALAPDKYSVAILPTNLRSSDGGNFCVVKNDGLCLNNTNCVYHFTLDGFNAPGTTVPLTTGPTPALPLPQIMAIDDEIRIFFSDHVDFQSLVGFNTTTGRVNVTTQDPFISLPLTLNQVAAMGANFRVDLTIPATTSLPPETGCVVYMANPFRDPTEVRIRFVDVSNLNGIDDPTGATTGGTPSFQNYALPSAVWDAARLGNNTLVTPKDNNPSSATFGSSLELPAKMALPGSSVAGPVTLQATVFSMNNPNASDSSASNAAMMDGTLGVTDRARRALDQDIVVTRTLANGPLLTMNAIPPDLHLIKSGRTLDGLDSAGVTIDGTGGTTLTGTIFRINQNFNDINTLESISDVFYGAFFNPANLIINPPRRLNPQAAVATKLLPQNFNDPTVPTPGMPFPPGQTAEFALMPPPMLPLPAPPFGTRIYVVDNVRSRVQVLNSYTFQPLGTIPGISSPRGLGGDGTFLYVSNFDQNTLTRVGMNPFQTVNFHQVVSTTPVGNQPTTVSVQRGNEDIVVLNSGANTITFVDLPTFTQRASFPVGMGSKEVQPITRWTGMGTTFTYQCYVTNQLSNSVTIYESDTPLITEPNGPQGKIIFEFGGLNSPFYGGDSNFVGPFNGIGAAGILAANSAGSTTTYVGWVNFGFGQVPGFPGPPSFRSFAAVTDYMAGTMTGPSDSVVENFTFIDAMTSRLVLVTYPGSGQVASIDFNTGVFYGAITLPGTQIFSSQDY